MDTQARITRKLRSAISAQLRQARLDRPSSGDAPDIPRVQTARPIFEQIADELHVEPSVIELIFVRGLLSVLDTVKQNGKCTIRGVGSFSHGSESIVFKPSRATQRES